MDILTRITALLGKSETTDNPRDFHARSSSARGKWTGGRTGHSESTESGRAAGTRARLGSPRALAG